MERTAHAKANFTHEIGDDAAENSGTRNCRHKDGEGVRKEPHVEQPGGETDKGCCEHVCAAGAERIFDNADNEPEYPARANAAAQTRPDEQHRYETYMRASQRERT